MYVYGKLKNEKSGEEWKTFKEDEKDKIEELFHRSIYKYGEQHLKDGSSDYSKIRMFGDFTIDIDSKDLTQAIAHINNLLDHLERKYEINLDLLTLSCSGSKGFHIIIPQRLIEDKPKSIVYLNRIHSWMAAVIGAECDVPFDMSLYQQRHLLRVANKPREDNRYKVPVTVEEVRSLTPSKYLELVSSPRHLVVTHIIPENQFSIPLNELWLEAKVKVKEQGNQSRISPVPDEQLAAFTNRPPLCIEWQVNGEKLHRDSQFNRLSMNVASFVAHAGGMDDKTRQDLIDRFVKNAPSDSRNEDGKRRHISIAIRNAQSGNQQFGCGFNRSQLDGNPCNGCSIKEAREADSELITQIEAREDGYYSVNSKGDGMKLTTFTLERKNEIIEHLQGRKVLVGELFEIKVFIGRAVETQLIDIGTEDWTSLSAFKKTTSAVSGAIVKATSEIQLSNLREYINNSQLREGLMRNELVGVQVSTSEDGNEDRIWLEPGWSINSKGISSSYHYTGTVEDTVMSLRGVRPAGPNDGEVALTLLELMDSNKPASVAQMLGWACACHLKSHINHIGSNEFPLLHISGKPESGKTGSATVYSALTGAMYLDGPMTAETASAFPLKNMLSETSSVARILDEFNKGQLKGDRYNTIYGYLKSLYCRQTVATGYAGKANRLQKISAAVVGKAATSPMIFMSREATENEELRSRSIIIRIAKTDQLIGDYAKNFKSVALKLRSRETNGNPVQRMTKLLVTKALRMDTGTVRQWLDETIEAMKIELPEVKESRRIVNIQAVLVGLRFLTHACEGFDQRVLDRINELKAYAIEEWTKSEKDAESFAMANSTSEIVLRTFATMASQPPESAYDSIRLRYGYHHILQGKTLWINPRLILLPYQIYTQRANIQTEFTTAKGLLDLMKETTYFLKEGSPAGVQGRDMICLDLTVLEKMGVVYASDFEEA